MQSYPLYCLTSAFILYICGSTSTACVCPCTTCVSVNSSSWEKKGSNARVIGSNWDNNSTGIFSCMHAMVLHMYWCWLLKQGSHLCKWLNVSQSINMRVWMRCYEESCLIHAFQLFGVEPNWYRTLIENCSAILRKRLLVWG